MTAGEILAQVDGLRPNAYSREQKLCWLRRLDGQILCELEQTHRPTPLGFGSEENGGADAPVGPPVGHLPVSPAEQCSTLRETPPSPPVGHLPLSPAEQCSALRETPPSSSLTAPLAGEPAALPAAYGADTELLAPFPWGEGLYTAWLFCQIDLHNGEIQQYNQSLQLLAAAWRSLADWLNRTRMPRGAAAWRM